MASEKFRKLCDKSWGLTETVIYRFDCTAVEKGKRSI